MSIPPPSAGPPGPLSSRPELPEGVARPDPPPPEPPPGDHAWASGVPLWSPLAIALAAFVVAGVVFAVVAGVAGLSGAEAEDAPGPILLGTLFQDLLLVIGAALATGYAVGRARIADRLGLRRTAFWPAVGWSAVTVLGFMFAAGLVVAIFGEPAEQDLAEQIERQTDTLAVAGYIGLICIAAPAAEELFFRGFLFPLLSSRFGVYAGVFGSSALFAFVHAAGSPAESLIVLFVLGAGLCLLYLRTRSLLPCIGLHALNNSISFVATKDMEWPLAVVTVVGSVIVAVGIGMAWTRRPAPVAA